MESNNSYGVVYGTDNIYTDVSKTLKGAKDMQLYMILTRLELDLIPVIMSRL